jgi:hypothetical protein
MCRSVLFMLLDYAYRGFRMAFGREGKTDVWNRETPSIRWRGTAAGEGRVMERNNTMGARLLARDHG